MADEQQTSNSDSEFKVPKWINADLIQKALQNSGEGKVQVEDLSIRMGTAPGDNYASTLYRVHATLSDRSVRSLLVKGPPTSQIMDDANDEMRAFQREGLMLADIIPQLEALLEEAAPGRFPPFAARCLLYGSDPVEFLVLQDLAPAGFKMADRKRGLGLRHSLLALQNLARFHAASHALLQRRPELEAQLPNPRNLESKNKDLILGFIEGGIQNAADGCRLWPGYEEYATLLDKFKPTAADCYTKVGTPKPGEFMVILHADYWVNNMMFRYEDGNVQPKEHRMVDFQVSTAGSPAMDLHYFFSTSVTDNVSAHHEDLLLREYHNTLVETLKLLKLEAPSFGTLLKDVDAHGLFSLMGALNIIPIVRAQRAPDFDAGLEDSAALTHLYEDPAVKKWMQRVLPEYKRRGWLPS